MRNNRAFTLAETLMVFIIMGVLATLTISSVKPWEKTYKHIYSRVYNALSTTIYNYMVETGEFPEEASDLCKAIVKYMNTTKKLTESACTGNVFFTRPGDNYASVTSDDEPKRIKLSNGSHLYFDRPESYKYPNNENPSLKFHIVYVDLNGSRKPNSPNHTATQLPDLVPFAITDKFTVVPLGYPQLDMKYLQAHLVTPSLDADEDDQVSDPMIYRAAQVMAFGTGTTDAISSVIEPMALDLQSLVWGSGSPYYIDWESDSIKDITALINASGDEVAIKDLSIEESCKFSNHAGYTDPVCSVKIYDYH